ncbi:MAG: AzlC family ABC transporter permease [Anaerolineales bacterium]
MTADLQAPPPRAEFLRGARDQLPILLGVVPFGIIFGALALANGLPPDTILGFSFFVFAGSAQFIAAELIAGGAPAFITVLTIAVVNLRHLLYSASIGPALQPLQAGWRWTLSWLLTDEAFATSSVHYRRHPNPNAHWYMLGTGLALWGSWQISTLAGVVLGAALPTSWNLSFALPLTFLALLIPLLDDRRTVLSAASAGLAGMLLAGLPFRLGLLFAAFIGIGVGYFAERAQLAGETD